MNPEKGPADIRIRAAERHYSEWKGLPHGDAKNRKRLERSFFRLVDKIDGEDPFLQYLLGQIYEWGHMGVEQNREEALFYYRKSVGSRRCPHAFLGLARVTDEPGERQRALDTLLREETVDTLYFMTWEERKEVIAQARVMNV